MKHNQNAFAPESATDEPGSSPHHADPEAPRFATAAEEAAYRAGLDDGLHGDRARAAAFDFDPISTRHRIDGLTPEKQREYVEALADTGISRQAAARIGVSERSISRLRRRADAASFNLACEAARRFGARNLHATAWERAIEGTIKQHYYHGELKGEERVYDNRLLIYLLGKTEHLLDEPGNTRVVAANWEPFVEAMEQGLPPPDLRSARQRERDEMFAIGRDTEEEGEDGLQRDTLWENEGDWRTSYPPPFGFDGYEDGVPGEPDYRRSLTEAEQAVLTALFAEEEKDRAEAVRRACARRDRFFGFEGGLDPSGLPEGEAEEEEAPEEAEIFSRQEAGPSGPSEPPVDDAQPPAGAADLYEPSWLRSRRPGGDADAGVPLSPE